MPFICSWLTPVVCLRWHLQGANLAINIAKPSSPMCLSQMSKYKKWDFERDGVTFPTTEIQIDFINPVDSDGDMFPTGNLIDILTVPNVGEFEATLINAGMPTIFICASDL